MKNLHEELKNELRSRLRNYREKPEDTWWDEIAPNIGAPPTSRARVWVLRISLVLFIIVVLSPISDVLDDSGKGRTPMMSEDSKVEERTANSKELNTATNKEVRPTETAPKIVTIIPSDVPFKTQHNEMTTPGDPSSSDTNTRSDQTSDSYVDGQKVTDSRIDVLSSTEFAPEQDSSQIEHPDLVKEILPAHNPTNRRREGDSRRKYSAYLNLMPTFGYQRITSNDQDNILIQSINRIPAFSASRLGIRAEIGIQRESGKKMKVFGGLLYYQRKQTIDYIEKLIDTTMLTPGPGGIVVEPGFKYDEKSFEFEIRNIGLQLGVNYLISKGKFVHTVGTGLEFQIALNKISQKQQDLGFTENPTAYVFYNLFYRLEYPAEGRLRAAFQPTLNYSFYINQNFNAPFYVKPYGLGLNVGATYQF
jgi:hypothetical protein